MKKLEELFNMPTDVLLDDEVDAEEAEHIAETVLPSTLDAIDKIDASLPMVKGLEASDEELDRLAKMASESYKDLMSLGMNVEARWSSEIFSSASSMLGHAISATKAKVDKKLKMVDMQLKKAKLDQATKPPEEEMEGTLMDRNEILEKLINERK